MTTPPDWVTQYVQEARSLFGVGGPDWYFIVNMVDNPGDDATLDGMINTSGEYLNANIELRSSMEEGSLARISVYHEVLHAVHAEIDEVFYHAMGQLSPRDKDMLAPVYRMAVERFVQRLSRSIESNLVSNKQG